VSGTDRLREEVNRLQEKFIDEAIVLRQLRQDRRYAANDDVVYAAEQQLGQTLREWHSALQQLQEAGQERNDQ